MADSFYNARKQYSLMYLGVVGLHLVGAWLVNKLNVDILTIELLVTAALYVVLSFLARKVSDIKVCFNICFAEILITSILGTLLCGYQSGFALYTICIMPLSFYSAYADKKNPKLPLVYVVIEIVTFFAMTAVSMYLDTGKNLNSVYVKWIYIINSFAGVALLVVFFLAFIRITSNTEENLLSENKALKNSANYDALTGLLNRRTFDHYIQKQLKGVYKYGKSFCVVMCDIDNFKFVNDTYGHDCGDIVLKEIGNIIQSQLRNNDQLFRWGGEEFLILLSAPSSVSSLIMNRIRLAVSDAKIAIKDDTKISVTISIGISDYTKMITSDILIKQADEALYTSKNNGKNRITVFEQKEE